MLIVVKFYLLHLNILFYLLQKADNGEAGGPALGPDGEVNSTCFNIFHWYIVVNIL